jgi:glycosyltransferase involved in cell wall biosynthesis
VRPLISIGIPTYNGDRFIAECLESILAQTFTNIEIIVIDDCSSDRTVAIAKSYAEGDPRVSVHLNSSRLGLVGNFNRCIAQAQGKYVCIFGQDDVMLPDNLSVKYETIESHPNVAFVHSNVLRVYQDGKVFAEHWATTSASDYVQAGTQLLTELLAGQNQICCPSVLVRKDCLDRLGGFDERLFFACDWEMWMRLCADYDVACLGRPLIKFRRHGGTETNRVAGKWLELEQELLAKQIMLARLPDWQSRAVTVAAWNSLARRALDIARKAFYENDFDNFRRCLLFAIRIQPNLFWQTDNINLLLRALLGRRLIAAYRSVMSTIER